MGMRTLLAFAKAWQWIGDGCYRGSASGAYFVVCSVLVLGAQQRSMPND
jgi:hypothetical protein